MLVTREQADAFFARRNRTIIYFERLAYLLTRRWETLVEYNGGLEIWAWDSSHGGGGWCCIDDNFSQS